MQACERCHARKTRCDRRIPQCSACEKVGVPCLHTDKLRQRNIPRGYIDSMEKMVKDLREKNVKLRNELQNRPHMPPEPPTASLPEHHNPDESVGPHDGSSSPPAQADARAETDGSTSTPVTRAHVDNAFSIEVGYLSLTATGETRYLGSSSGMGLANLISTAISAQSGLSFSAETNPSDNFDKISCQAVPADATFPSLAVATPFIQAYFQHTHIAFPLLHRPNFMMIVDRIYGEPGFYEFNPFDAFVFDMVLAIGSSNFNRFEEAGSTALRFYAMAQSKAALVMSLDGLSVLRAILLICQHGIFSHLRDTSASIWHLIGIGARLCSELGLHLEHGQLNGGARQTQQAKFIETDEEMRRRCFWCLYNLDRVVSFTLGRPCALRDEEIDVLLPSPLEDEELTSTRSRPPTSTDEPRPLSPFLHIIRIRQISGQILSMFYNSRRLIHSSFEEKNAARLRLHNDLLEWKRDTKRLCSGQAIASQIHVSCFQSEEWYDAVYNNAMLLLYRPSPCFPHPSIVSPPDSEKGELLRLLDAAKGSLESYNILHQRRRLNYSWITLHGVFIAGLAYIYSVGRILRDARQHGLLPDVPSIVEVTRGCSNVLVAICERWNVSRRSCELFNKLSDAVIKDCVNAMCKPSSTFPRPSSGSSNEGVHVPTSGVQNAESSLGNPIGEAFPQQGAPNATPQLDDILVIDEFKNYSTFFDLMNQTEASFPSELVAGFSQEWSFESPFYTEAGFDANMHMATVSEEAVGTSAGSWVENQ